MPTTEEELCFIIFPGSNPSKTCFELESIFEKTCLVPTFYAELIRFYFKISISKHV